MIRPLKAKLDVIAVVSNPVRYESRYKLYERFEKQMLDQPDVRFTTVELAFGNREHEITDSDNPRHIQLRTRHELWHKENLVNIGISRLPRDWEYVAWIDTDIVFNNPNWVQETLQQLQHYYIVQMWSHAIDMGPKYQPAKPNYTDQIFKSWMYCYCNDIPARGEQVWNGMAYENIGGTYWHPGFAWAADRHAIDTLGGLIDWAILGSGDHHMACAFTGTPHVSNSLSTCYKDRYKAWSDRASTMLGDFGYVDGTITHGWHGRKRERGYKDRWKILAKHGYNPDLDIFYDHQGVLQLTDRVPKFRDDIRSYFRARNEDSIDIE